MSQYADFVQDSPERCQDVLSLYQGPAVAKGREVTLSLMVATSRLLMVDSLESRRLLREGNA
jgi:hypothetical protein